MCRKKVDIFIKHCKFFMDVMYDNKNKKITENNKKHTFFGKFDV